MAVFSPYHNSLYRTVSRIVILVAIAALISRSGQAQYSKRTVSKGPRALGLVELAPNGKAHLIPITILTEGKFYDAGAYKASPVPMALESQTVYEALRTGVSQGLFTVTDAREVKNTNNWIADGSWLPAGAAPPKTGREAENKPIMGDNDAPPTLRRGTTTPTAETAPGETKAQTPPQSTTSPQPAPAPTAPPANAPPNTTAAPPQNPSSSPPQEEDKNRPVLHRGKPAGNSAAADEDVVQPLKSPSKPSASSSKSTAPAATPSAASASVQLLPAISDADGPDPRPYTYDVKPDEEQKYRQKILALASEEIRTRERELGAPAAEPTRPTTSSARRKAAAQPPRFDDVQLRFFDLSTSNEPVLVLTATARVPRPAGFAPPTADELQYFITLVARADIYGELRKLFSNVTDTRHLDAIPRMELIDAVDVDGDGRGELLFRQISDAGTAFNVYRVTGDQLWPLFEGTPQ